MRLAEEYRQQYRWRAWDSIFAELPLEPGQTVFDLGCAVGDQARALASRGCRVIGLDSNRELIDAAVAGHPPGCQFLACDLRHPPDPGVLADGLWCSFAAAYMVDLVAFLKMWGEFLRGGGWIAVTEIDDLFGHAPLSERTRSLLQGFADDARACGRYDFRMGGKLRDCLGQAGFAVTRVLTLPDQEFCFEGAAAPEVLEAWRRRLQRMPGLRRFCASAFAQVEEEFLSCLARPDHVATARVIACIATKAG